MLDIYSIPTNDQETWNLIGEGKTKGIFQLESHLGRKWCKEIRPRDIDQLAAVISLIRPGCLKAMSGDPPKSMTQHYADRNRGEEEIEYISDALEPILCDNLGIQIYQEDAIRISQEIAGFSLEEADKLRKCISKGSLVHTDIGLIPIEQLCDMKSLPNIYTIEMFMPCKKPLESVWHTGKQVTITLKTKNGHEITVTPTHQIYTLNKGWIECQNIDIGYEIISIYKNCVCIDKVIDIIDNDIVDTYDYRINDEHVHWGFVDNILVHNSIGKKRADLMSELENDFVEGCIKTRNMDRGIATEIFSWIKESQKYGFNKSITYDTTVETSDGKLKQIADITTDEYIKTPNNKYVKVLAVYDHGEQPVYKLTLENGNDITCTMQHKFLCNDGIVRKLQDIIKYNHKIIVDSIDICKACSIKSVEYAGVQPTMDIEVDSENHIFYGNGIATSNSHATSYAMNGYRTAYLKTHYPLEFFVAWLRGAQWKQDVAYAIHEMVGDARSFGIVVNPPTLLDRNTTVYPKDGQIYFGIGDILGVGESGLNKIFSVIDEKEQLLDKTLSNFSTLEFIVHIANNVNSSVIKALCGAGALDFLGCPRKELDFLLQQYRNLSKGEQSWIASYMEKPSELIDKKPTTLLELIKICNHPKKTKKNADNPPHGCCHNAKRKTVLDSLIQHLENPPYDLHDSKYEIIKQEKQYIGVSLTYSESDNRLLQKHANVTCHELNEGTTQPLLMLAGTVTETKIVTVQRGESRGSEMAFFNVEDETGVCDGIIAFSDAWKNFKDYLQKGNNILLQLGRGKGCFTVDSVWVESDLEASS